MSSTSTAVESPGKSIATVNAARDPRAIAFARSLFATLGFVSPALAARLAERAFVRPRRIPAPAHELEVRDRADEVFTISHKAEKLHALRWGSGDRTVLLVHGWEGRGTQLGRFVDSLLAAGYRVITFDGPAHGHSPGAETELVHFSKVFPSIVQSVGPIHGVIAHSFGAAAACVALNAGIFQPRRLVLIGSPSRLLYPLGQFRSVVGLPDPVWERFLVRMEKRLGIHPRNLDLAHMADSLDAPCLIIHCRDDNEVTYDNAMNLHTGWPGAQLLTTDGLGHRRILKDPDVIHAAIQFIDN